MATALHLCQRWRKRPSSNAKWSVPSLLSHCRSRTRLPLPAAALRSSSVSSPREAASMLITERAAEVSTITIIIGNITTIITITAPNTGVAVLTTLVTLSRGSATWQVTDDREAMYVTRHVSRQTFFGVTFYFRWNSVVDRWGMNRYVYKIIHSKVCIIRIPLIVLISHFRTYWLPSLHFTPLQESI